VDGITGGDIFYLCVVGAVLWWAYGFLKPWIK
jgi:hypothetical protein